jgi:hypothetical protein
MPIETRPSGSINRPYETVKDALMPLSNGEWMFVPDGYPTDFASIPSVLKLFLEWKGAESDAYIVHDYLYNRRGYLLGKTGRYGPEPIGYGRVAVSRKWADQEMRWQMERLGSPRWRRNLYYLAVRVFARGRWGRI